MIYRVHMKLFCLVIFVFLISCSNDEQQLEINISPNVNHVSRIMLTPDFFVNKKIDTFGILTMEEGGHVLLIPDESFKGLSFSLLIPHTISISRKVLDENKQIGNILNKNCFGEVVEITGLFKKAGIGGYRIEPDIIIKAVEGDISSKDCFLRK